MPVRDLQSPCLFLMTHCSTTLSPGLTSAYSGCLTQVCMPAPSLQVVRSTTKTGKFITTGQFVPTVTTTQTRISSSEKYHIYSWHKPFQFPSITGDSQCQELQN